MENQSLGVFGQWKFEKNFTYRPNLKHNNNNNNNNNNRLDEWKGEEYTQCRHSIYVPKFVEERKKKTRSFSKLKFKDSVMSQLFTKPNIGNKSFNNSQNFLPMCIKLNQRIHRITRSLTFSNIFFVIFNLLNFRL